MNEKLPTSFKDLRVAELRRSAIEDFAVEVDSKATSDEVVAALAESGVEWKDYLECHPEARPVQAAPVEAAPTVVSKEVITDSRPAREDVVVQQPLAIADQPYLIKMERDNPLYQTLGYTFTSSHPYQLVKAEDAQYILSEETGFRQAFPNELAEFYG